MNEPSFESVFVEQSEGTLIKAKPWTIALEDTNLVGYVHSFGITSQANEGLLKAEGRDKSVDFGALNIVELVHGIPDLSLVGTHINKEGENVIRLASYCH